MCIGKYAGIIRIAEPNTVQYMNISNIIKAGSRSGTIRRIAIDMDCEKKKNRFQYSGP